MKYIKVSGEKIRQARKAKGLTQAALGELLGVSGSMIGQYETEARRPSFKTASAVAHVLNIDDLTVEFEADLQSIDATSLISSAEDIGNRIRRESLEQISAALAHREKLSEEILADWEQNKDAYLSNIQSAKDNLIRVAERICTDIQETDDEAQRISDTRWLPTRLNMIAEFINANEKTLRLAFPGWRESSLPQANGNSEDK